MPELLKIYHKSRKSMKHLAKKFWLRKVPFPDVMSREFTRAYNRLLESQWYSIEQHREIQHRKLMQIINHAYEHVPYYRKIFDERSLKPENIQDFDDLGKLPILTKDDVRKHFKDITAQNYMEFEPTIYHTSGSTGVPLNYYIDRNLSTLTSACVQRHWQWCGFEPKDIVAVFRGTLIDEFGMKRRNYWKLENNQIHFSTFEMSDDVMAEYVEQLNKRKPALIRGYPSSLEILANFINNKSMKVPSPKAIHTCSETVSQGQRVLIEGVFSAPLFDWYGHGESTVNAGECDKHKGLHLGLEYGYTELIKTPETEGMENIYNIVSTSLHNYSMPFIRYDTEDLALLENKSCSCGRELTLISSVMGRQADIIEGVNGVKVSPSSFVHFWKYRVADHLSDIDYAQIIQKDKSVIQIKLVGERNQKNEEIITEQVRILLGDVQINFEYIQQIPTGQKWRFTVSEIS